MSSEAGSPGFRRQIPEGDSHERLVCENCGWIHYENPRVVVGTVATWSGRVLLCRRAIAPREGYWTVPAGFMELGESCEEGAIRETREETGARVRIRRLLGIYSLPHIGQVHLIYRAEMLSADLDAGPECHEARLYRPAEIPWKDLAFSTNRWALEHFLRAEELAGPLEPFTEPPSAP